MEEQNDFLVPKLSQGTILHGSNLLWPPTLPGNQPRAVPWDGMILESNVINEDKKNFQSVVLGLFTDTTYTLAFLCLFTISQLSKPQFESS